MDSNAKQIIKNRDFVGKIKEASDVYKRQPVDSAEHFSFRFLQSSRFSALSSHIAKLNPLFADVYKRQVLFLSF